MLQVWSRTKLRNTRGVRRSTHLYSIRNPRKCSSCISWYEWKVGLSTFPHLVEWSVDFSHPFDLYVTHPLPFSPSYNSVVYCCLFDCTGILPVDRLLLHFTTRVNTNEGNLHRPGRYRNNKMWWMEGGMYSIIFADIIITNASLTKKERRRHRTQGYLYSSNGWSY